MKKIIYSLTVLTIFATLIFSCSSENNSNTENTPSLPTVTTYIISNSGLPTASSGGNVVSDGGASVTSRGVVWSTNQNPTIADSKTTDGTGTGIFYSSLSTIVLNQTYYIRAYATNSVGTAYGNQIIYSANNNVALPTLTTTTISNITSSTALSGGNISLDGGTSVISRGVVWSTNQNPTIANTKTVDGTGIGIFSSSITGLLPNTTYYLRAYATNSAGTAYGNQLSFTTITSSGTTTVTDIDGNTYPTIQICNQIWTQKNLNVSKYRNGDVIPQVQDAAQWNNLTTGAWCYYENQTANGTIYGKLYNWYAVNDSRGLAPAGCHIPSQTEWVTLVNCLGGLSPSGSSLKESGTAHWISPNTGTNISNFTALPGGHRNPSSSNPFDRIGIDGNWWTSTSTGNNSAYSKVLVNSITYTGTDDSNNSMGFSVRCIKD